MAKSGKTAQEFIQYSFSPVVAVLTSPKVDNIVSKNNLTFVELLQPFTLLDWEGQFREPAGSWCTVRNWKLNIRDVHWKPLQPTEARKELNNAVILNYHDIVVAQELGKHKFDIPQSTIWFDAWRETYFEVQFPSDHEYTKHFVACMLVATTQDENIIDTFNGLLQQLSVLQNVAPPKLPKWFNNDILKSYILLHDPSVENKEKVQSMFDMMQQMYGSHNCFLLKINSRSSGESDKEPVIADLWAPYIRHSEVHNELLSPHSNAPQSPVDSGVLTSNNNTTGTAQDDFTTLVPTETPHPLTANEDVYDRANSLQNDSLSGSVESVSIDRKGGEVTTETHGGALSTSDVDTLKQFMKDYAAKALLPYFERQISLLSDVVANRKGVSRSLLSATKRWFGTGKAGTTAATNTVIYSNECPELQLRRLGDLWFMSGQWQRAYDTYHTAKREFYADGAWLCYAGALEMAAISAFMAGDASRKTYGYIEESITTYLNTCRMVQYAVRATLLSVLCLNAAGCHGEAAKQLIRMTSEDSDLRSAMLLEQASLCFLSGPGPRGMARKYSFHMVLAGHRFSKAGQKKHAYRCYRQAYQVYRDSGWRLSTDHVQFALGRLAGALRLGAEALAWLAGPLAPASPQPLPQQRAFLREYMLALQQCSLGAERASLCVLPLPLVQGARTAVLAGGTPPLSAPRRVPACPCPAPGAPHWLRLERLLLQAALGQPPTPPFRPARHFYDAGTDNTQHPTVPQGEPLQITITLCNPLKIPLTMMDVELLWQFHPSIDSPVDSKEPLSNEPSIASGIQLKSNVISGQRIQSFTLEGESEKSMIFSITPLQVGELHLQGVAYKLCNGTSSEEYGSSIIISGKQILEIPDKSDSSNNESKNNQNDKRLQIKVVPCSPCLQMTFSEMTSHVVSGELVTADVEFRNAGPVAMTNLYVAASYPECISVMPEDGQHTGEPFSQLYQEKYQWLPDNLDERSCKALASSATCARHTVRVCPRLESGAALRCTLLLRPAAATPRLHLLAYYDGEHSPYRLLRHTFHFHIVDMVKVVAIPRRYIKLTDNDSALETMSLSVEVQNDKNEKDTKTVLEILETSLLGRQWKFTDFILSKDKSDGLTLHEKLHLVLRAKRIMDELPRDRVEWSSLKINPKHPESLPNINEPPFCKFVVDHKSSTLEDTNEIYDLEKEKKFTGLIQSMLVVRWKIHIDNNGDSRTALGQSYLWLDCFSIAHAGENFSSGLRNEITSLNFDENDSSDDVLLGNKNNKKKDDIVMFRMEHANHIKHSFKQRKLCVVPVDIHFVNCYRVPVKAFMNMSSKSKETSGRADCGQVGWAGALSAGVGAGAGAGMAVSLGALQSRRVSVRALVAAPGTYLLAAALTLHTDINTHTHTTEQHMHDSTVLVVKDAPTCA